MATDLTGFTVTKTFYGGVTLKGTIIGKREVHKGYRWIVRFENGTERDLAAHSKSIREAQAPDTTKASAE